MLPLGIRKFFGNLIGSFVPDCLTRRRIRVNIVAPLWRCMRFVRRMHRDDNITKLERFYGQGGKSLVIGVNDSVVYKFSCMHDADNVTNREYAIVSYFRNISPIYTPNITVLAGPGGLVRRYEYVHGVAMSHLTPKQILDNAETLGRQIAEFLFIIASYDPDELKQYKAHKNDIPRMYYGWNHTDFDNIENFIVDPKTMKITAVIDWENATFGDFYNRTFRPSRPHMVQLFDVVRREYEKMYNDKIANLTR